MLAEVVEGLVVPAAAQRALHARRDAEGLGDVLDEALVQPAHFLGRELAMPEIQRAGELVVEDPVLAAVGVLVLPAQDVLELPGAAVARRDVGEEREGVAGGVVERGDDVGALALADDRAVADRAVAAAVEAGIAVGTPTGAADIFDRPVIELRERLAGVRARIDVDLFGRLHPHEVAPRDRRALGRAVLGAVLNVAVIGPDRTLIDELAADHQVEVVLGIAARDVDALAGAAAVLVAAEGHVDRRAVDLLLQIEVHHARDGVRAVDGRGAAAQHLDAVDHAQRDRRGVGEGALAVVGQREIGDAAAVDQHQRMVGAQAAQVDLLGAGCPVHAAGRLLGLGFAAVLGQGAHDVRDAVEARGLDVVAGDDRDGGGAFGRDARDARAGDHQRLDGVVAGGRRRLRGRLADDQKAGRASQCAGAKKMRLHGYPPFCCADGPVLGAQHLGVAPRLHPFGSRLSQIESWK